MEKARRPQVPAFGEWNYYYHYDEPEAAAAAAWYAKPEPQACSDVWFKYSPPPRKPAPKKQQARRRRAAGCDSVSRERQSARPSLDAAAAAKGGNSRRVVRPVDADLYQVPPPEFTPNRRSTKQRRSLWMMGCLGCVA